MLASLLATYIPNVSCPCASSVDAVLSLIVGGARIKVKKFQSTINGALREDHLVSRKCRGGGVGQPAKALDA